MGIGSGKLIPAAFYVSVLLLSAFFPVPLVQLKGRLELLPDCSAMEYSSLGGPTSWPMFRHDQRHTGYSSSLAPVTNTSLWTFATGNVVESSPAVVDGMIFIGSADNNVYALNESTGKSVWNHTTRGVVYSSPAVVDDVVFVGSRDNSVYALDRFSGVQIWSYTTGAKVDTSPTVADGIVCVGSDDGRIYALDQSTGGQIWNFTTGDSVMSSSAVAGGVVFFGSRDDRVYALNGSTGEQLWNYTTLDDVVSSPAVSNGAVFVGSFDNRIYALNASSGEQIWNYTTGSNVWASPAVASGVVYAGSRDHRVYALNETTGAQIWNYTTSGEVWSSPAVTEGIVFVGSDNNRIHALNQSTGSQIWSYMTPYGYVRSSPAVADGHLFVGAGDHAVHCFGPQILFDSWPMFHHDQRHTGSSFSDAPTSNDTRWFFRTGDRVSSSPAVVDGVVLIGSMDGDLYALDEDTGLKLWNFTTNGEIISSPALANGRVFVGSRDSLVYALNQSTGEQTWNYTTQDSVLASPVAAGGLVIIGSNDNNVYALNQTTGQKEWNFATQASVQSGPAVVDGRVFVGSNDKNVYALSLSTGARIWNYTTGGSVSCSPAVVDGRVFVGSSDNQLYALNASTGTRLWNHTTGDSVESSPAVADGMVFVGSLDFKVYALNESTGAVAWTHQTGDWVLSSPAVADGMVFVGSWDYRMYALNESTGAVVWSYLTGAEVRSSPAVADDMVFVGSWDNAVYCFSSAPLSPSVLCEQESKIGLNATLASWNLTRNTLQDPWFNFSYSFLNDNVFDGVTLDGKVLLDTGFTLVADVPVAIVTVVPEAVPQDSDFNFLVRAAPTPSSLRATFWLEASISLEGSYNLTAIVENVSGTGQFPSELKWVLANVTELIEAMEGLTEYLRLVTGQNMSAWLMNALGNVSSIRQRITDVIGYVDRTYRIYLGYGRISETIEVNPWDVLISEGFGIDQYINDANAFLDSVESLLLNMKGAVEDIEDLVDQLIDLVASFPAGSFNYSFKLVDFTKTLDGNKTLYGDFSLPLGDFVFDLRNDLPSVISQTISNVTRVTYIQTLLAAPITVDALFDIGLVPQLSVSAWLNGNATAVGANLVNPSFTLKNYSDYANLQAHSLNQPQPIELSLSNFNYTVNATFALIPFVDLYLQVPYFTIPITNLVEHLPPNVKSQLQLIIPVGKLSIPINGTVTRTVQKLTDLQGVACGFTINEREANQTVTLVDWNLKKDSPGDPFLTFHQTLFEYNYQYGLVLSGTLLLDSGLNINFTLPLKFRQLVPKLGIPGRAFTLSTQLIPSTPEIEVHFWTDLNTSFSATWHLDAVLQSIINDPSFPLELRNTASELLATINEFSSALDYLSSITSWSTSTLTQFLDGLEDNLEWFKDALDSFKFEITISIDLYFGEYSHTFSFNFFDALKIGGVSLRSLVTGAVSSVSSKITTLKAGINNAESVALKVIGLLDDLSNFLMDGTLPITLNLLDIDFQEDYPMTEAYGHPLHLPIGLHSYDLRYDLPGEFVATTNRTKFGIDALTHFYVSFSIIPAPVTIDLMADVDFTPILKGLGNITGRATATGALFETEAGARGYTVYTLEEYYDPVWLEGKFNPDATSDFTFTFSNLKYNFQTWIEITPSVEFFLDIPVFPIPVPLFDLYDLMSPIQVSFPLGSASVSLPGSFQETVEKGDV